MLSEFSWTTLLLTASVAAAPMALQDVLNSWKQSPLSRYPTDFTRDIATVRRAIWDAMQLCWGGVADSRGTVRRNISTATTTTGARCRCTRVRRLHT